jgi:hypothetical protein
MDLQEKHVFASASTSHCFACFFVKVSLASASHCFPYFCKFGVKQIEFGRLNQGKQWQDRKLVNLQERKDILKTK